MQVRNQQAYKKWYGAIEKSPLTATGVTILLIAERWATLMEHYIAQGASVPKAAEATYGRAVGANPKMALHSDWSDFLVDFLAECWQFGPALRKWYGPKK